MSIEVDKEAFFARIGYAPHSAGQRAFHNSKARFRVACAGRRWGKSRCAGADTEPMLFVPRKRIWIVGPVYDLGEKEFRVIWNDLIIGQRLGRDKRVKKAYNRRSGEMYIEFPWQTRLEVRSADRPDTLVGDALDHVIMSEAAKHKRETWSRYIEPALADTRGSAIFPSTPESKNWFYDMFMLGLNKNEPEYESFHFPSWDNPHVFPGGRDDPEIKRLERTTGGSWFKQEIAADFTSFVGKIFEEWDEELHVKNIAYDPNLPNYMGLDWGFTNPTAAVEFQVDSWDRIRVWREHYLSGTTLEDHVEILKHREQPPGYRGVDLAFGDAADPEACEYVSRHFAPCVSDSKAKTNWRQGIELLISKLKAQQIGEADEYGTPMMRAWFEVDFSCVNTIREMGAYRAEESLNGSHKPKMSKDVDSHCVDALRYSLMHLFVLGARTHLTDVYRLQDLQSGRNEKSSIFSIDSDGSAAGLFTWDMEL